LRAEETEGSIGLGKTGQNRGSWGQNLRGGTWSITLYQRTMPPGRMPKKTSSGKKGNWGHLSGVGQGEDT